MYFRETAKNAQLHSLRAIVKKAEIAAAKDPAESSLICANGVDLVSEFEDKLRLQELASYYAKLAKKN